MKPCSRRDFMKLMGLATLSPLLPLSTGGMDYSSAQAADRNTGTYDIKRRYQERESHKEI